ncbi:MAG: hypothetical protein IPL00_19200 [Gammaproteobacteria bacterium]|nr:hypothetical protein [Gammaproteobacteria bacterium]
MANPSARALSVRMAAGPVVIRRALQVQADRMTGIQFTPGQVLRSAFAVWDGGNQERAGIKAFSPAWLDLKLEA